MKSNFLLACALFLLANLSGQSKYEFERISKLPFANLEVLDSVVGGYKVFFTGENHTYIAENSNIKLEMLRYLNKKAGVTNLIIELGFARGYMLNQYINGDTSYFESMRYTTGLSFLEMYKKLKLLNESLPEDRKITVHGVDVERFADDGPIMLARLLSSKKPVPADLEFQVEVIKSYGSYVANKYKSYYDVNQEQTKSSYVYDIPNYQGFFDAKVIDTMIVDYTRDRSRFMSYLGDSFALFDRVFSSIIELRKYERYVGMPHQYVYRERKIYENVTALINERPGQKFYGQFGRCHISQAEMNEECNWWAFSSTARRLNEGSAKDSVLSIGIFYNDRKLNRYFEGDYFNDFNTARELKSYIKMPCNDSNTLIRIDRRDTNLAKHYQYILLNNKCMDKNKKSSTIYDYDDFHEWAVMLDFGYGMAQYRLGGLNAALGSANKPFNQAMNFYSFGWSYSEFGMYTGTNVKLLLRQQNASGSLRYSLGGYSIVHNIGGIPSIGKRLAVGMYASFGFSKLALNFWKDSANTNFVQGFSSAEQMKYVNTAFVLGAGIDVRFAVASWLDLFAKGNFLLDVSNKSWRESSRYRNVTLLSSPKTGVGYLGLQAGLSLLLQE